MAQQDIVIDRPPLEAPRTAIKLEFEDRELADAVAVG